MIGGGSTLNVGRRGAISIAFVWMAVIVAAVTKLGIVAGLVVGGWLLPLAFYGAVLAAHSLFADGSASSSPSGG